METDHLILCQVRGEMLNIKLTNNNGSYNGMEEYVTDETHYIDKKEARLIIDVLTKYINEVPETIEV